MDTNELLAGVLQKRTHNISSTRPYIRRETGGLPVKGVVKRALTSVVEAVIDCANEETIDLIVTGTRGQGGFKRLLLGSVSGGVVTHAHCNVLVVS